MENDYIRDVQLEIMSDGTLHITANVDVANTNRILLSQAGTHLGDLYYRDDERKKGKWIDGYKRQTCSVCRQRGYRSWNFCPNCGADMRGDSE